MTVISVTPRPLDTITRITPNISLVLPRSAVLP